MNLNKKRIQRNTVISNQVIVNRYIHLQHKTVKESYRKKNANIYVK